MAVKRPHWSYSSISQYLRCPLQYYFQRILKLPKAGVGSGLVLGSAVHKALAEYHLTLQQKLQPQTEKIQQAFLDSWTHREELESIEYRNGETRDDLIAKGIALVEVYLKEPPPEQIVAVEQETVVPIRNSAGEYLEKPLVAFADLITREETGLRINEIKTSGRAYSQFEVETSLQATCYVNAAWETFGEWAIVEFTVLVKTKTPKLQRLKTARNEEDLGRLGDLVETIERGIKNGVFYPVETPLNCSTCPYREPCRSWKPDPSQDEPEVELHQLAGTAAC
ncbi:MAG: PD-(D/E)XK nuclease family protein [Planctomycetes bacterium]|nr:PD-(D/E)XK nuclease family protein [Planctomycetota bacterium]